MSSFDSMPVPSHVKRVGFGSGGSRSNNAMIEAFWSRIHVELLNTRG